MKVSRALSLDNRRMFIKLAVVAMLMFGFAYLLVPVYRAVCNALGINVLSLSELGSGAGPAEAPNTQVDPTRTITVEFDANARGPWDFKPEHSSLDVHPGELTTVIYEIHNRQNRSMAVQAIPSYAPTVAMAHFNKVQCFCFSEHVLGPGETKRWPVVFVIDSKLPKDVRTITLSYTFFEVNGKTPAAPTAEAKAPGTAEGAKS